MSYGVIDKNDIFHSEIQCILNWFILNFDTNGHDKENWNWGGFKVMK